MDHFFWRCVEFMKITAAWLGLTYEEWNVILFVIIHPLITVLFIFAAFYYRIKYLKKRS